MSTYVVNATAARESGALVILRQFLAAAGRYASGQRFLVFVAPGLQFAAPPTVQLVEVDTQRWRDRIRWDGHGFRRWLDEHGIVPEAILSLQNTGVAYDRRVPQLLYFHQNLTLERHRWNPLRKDERTYFLYRHVYPFFVARHLGRVRHVVVQRDSVGELFARRFRYPAERITVLRPSCRAIDYDRIPPVALDEGPLHLFYPAMTPAYKNHRLLVRAAALLRRQGLDGKVRIHLTCAADEALPFVREARRAGVEWSFAFEGVMPFERVLSFYRSADALLFPSRIETFGLPLLEAAGAGMPIVCSDLPYAHEVLGTYPGARYLAPDDAGAWAEVLRGFIAERPGRLPAHREVYDDWDAFFALLRRETSTKKP